MAGWGLRAVQLRFILLVSWAVAAGGVGSANETPSRLPVPTDEAQAKSTALIRNIFKTEFADRSPEVRHSLAEKLKTQAEATQDDPAGCFVLLRESRDLFAHAGFVRRAVGVAREMESRFKIYGATAETDTLAAARGTAKSPNAAVELASALLGVAVAALHGNDIDRANARPVAREGNRGGNQGRHTRPDRLADRHVWLDGHCDVRDLA